MARFTAQPLKHSDPAGDILQRARQERHFSVAYVARRLGMPTVYIEALEAGDWEALPQGDYGRYFLKQYAQFLELDVEDLLEQYPGPNLTKVVQPPKRAPINPTKTIHPLRSIILVLVALAVVAYLTVAARTIFLPPHLEIISPSDDGRTGSPTVMVSGFTKPGTEVTVNNEAVEVMESGQFTVSISLRPGLNILVVSARKSLSRQVSVERRIYYIPPVVPDAVPGEPSL